MPEDSCSVSGCDRKSYARGWCVAHYNRWLDHGTVQPDVPVVGRYRGVGCTIDDCESEAESRGWCNKHYKRWKQHGHPLAVKQMQGGSEMDRFMSKVQRLPNGCWDMQTGERRGGYRVFHTRSGSRSAHLWLWEQERGPVQPGYQLDHFRYPQDGCIGPACVNLDHLRPVTARENTLRGSSPIAWNAAKTRCKHDHEYTPANTRVQASGGRVCRTCARRWALEYAQRKRAASA